jgi:FkbM family methyltransferase
VVTSILRTPGRIFPIPGWFPVVVERVHPAVAANLERADIVTHGVRMRLDLRDYIQRRIFYESHEPPQVAFFKRFLKAGDVVVDVGAHVGFFTLIAASIAGSEGEVHAFEPVPSNFAALEQNVGLNGFGNVVLNRAAVGGEEGEVILGLPGEVPDYGATSAMYTAGGTLRSVRAPVLTLDSYLEDHIGERGIRLVKIDAEGLEPQVLAGLERRLAEAPPDAILLEVNIELLDRHGSNSDDLVRPLRQAGYRFYRPTPWGRLREFEPGAPSTFVREGDLPDQSPGLRGWVQRYHAESRIFFNVFALQPRRR